MELTARGDTSTTSQFFDRTAFYGNVRPQTSFGHQLAHNENILKSKPL